MTRFVALLRGVNVGGINLKMADVADAVTALGLSNVKTVLASGNLLFDSTDSSDALKQHVEQGLGERFGYDASVHILELDAIRRVVDDFPFDAERDGWHPYVVFVSDTGTATDLLALQDNLDEDSESIRRGDGVIYWTVERGSTLSSVFGKETGRARYKTSTTTRNLRTLQKLLR
ncbi:DUF1697 domain-containing protein [Glaciibacter sp. 2TAF33]|uniref:DUF1697 domain-containing protein n=1 Tax=Glaciibacter sp. 2TAF33 TaxID=3233015 RepID=UPI003F8F92E8